MQSGHVTIVNKRGLHARAAAKFVGVASQFNSQVMVLRDQATLNGKSIMGLLSLAASIGTELEIQTTGDDEIEALQALVDLVNRGFDETD